MADLLGNPYAAPETHQSTGVDRHLLFSVRTVPSILWTTKDQIDVGLSGPYGPAFTYSIFSMSLPLSLCLAVGLPGKPSRRETSGFSMFRIHHGMG